MNTNIKILSPKYLMVIALTGIMELSQIPTITPSVNQDGGIAIHYSTQGLQYTTILNGHNRREFADMCDQSENFRKLDDLSTFGENWNGYGANAFSTGLINRIRALLIDLPVQPELFPTARESIQLEYDVGENHIEIEVFDNNEVKVLSMIGVGKFTHESFSYDEKAIREVVDRFYASIAV